MYNIYVCVCMYMFVYMCVVWCGVVCCVYIVYKKPGAMVRLNGS